MGLSASCACRCALSEKRGWGAPQACLNFEICAAVWLFLCLWTPGEESRSASLTDLWTTCAAFVVGCQLWLGAFRVCRTSEDFLCPAAATETFTFVEWEHPSSCLCYCSSFLKYNHFLVLTGSQLIKSALLLLEFNNENYIFRINNNNNKVLTT